MPHKDLEDHCRARVQALQPKRKIWVLTKIVNRRIRGCTSKRKWWLSPHKIYRNQFITISQASNDSTIHALRLNLCMEIKEVILKQVLWGRTETAQDLWVRAETKTLWIWVNHVISSTIQRDRKLHHQVRRSWHRDFNREIRAKRSKNTLSINR